MSALYIHIPFCKTRCNYCDFYKQTQLIDPSLYFNALEREMEFRRDFFAPGEPLRTVYFGGGTPSQLSSKDFERIFEAIYRLYSVSPDAEITVEANPDDVDDAFVRMLRRLPFNRVSMGVQSFDAEDLRFLNRRHSREQAIRAVGLCRDAYIYNVSIDLIYGLPGQTEAKWEANVREALRLDIPHLSAYHLIYEEGTALYKLWEAGKVEAVDEETSVSLFSLLINRMREAGYLHYEISNFAREGYLSRHNSAYWTGKKYLGVGPSAHSYNGREREWNAASLPRWIAGIRTGQLAIEREELSPDTQYNDYVITGLRTMWGIRLDEIERRFGAERRQYCAEMAGPHLRRGVLRQEGERLFFSEAGVFVSDGVMSDLLFV